MELFCTGRDWDILALWHHLPLCSSVISQFSRWRTGDQASAWNFGMIVETQKTLKTLPGAAKSYSHPEKSASQSESSWYEKWQYGPIIFIPQAVPISQKLDWVQCQVLKMSQAAYSLRHRWPQRRLHCYYQAASVADFPRFANPIPNTKPIVDLWWI